MKIRTQIQTRILAPALPSGEMRRSCRAHGSTWLAVRGTTRAGSGEAERDAGSSARFNSQRAGGGARPLLPGTSQTLENTGENHRKFRELISFSR